MCKIVVDFRSYLRNADRFFFFVHISCQRLGVISLTYLWQRDQSELLREMLDAGINAVLIKVASMGLVFFVNE